MLFSLGRHIKSWYDIEERTRLRQIRIDSVGSRCWKVTRVKDIPNSTGVTNCQCIGDGHGMRRHKTLSGHLVALQRIVPFDFTGNLQRKKHIRYLNDIFPPRSLATTVATISSKKKRKKKKIRKNKINNTRLIWNIVIQRPISMSSGWWWLASHFLKWTLRISFPSSNFHFQPPKRHFHSEIVNQICFWIHFLSSIFFSLLLLLLPWELAHFDWNRQRCIRSRFFPFNENVQQMEMGWENCLQVTTE